MLIYILKFFKLKRENEILKKENETQRKIINTYIDTNSNENKRSERDTCFTKFIVPEELFDPKITAKFNIKVSIFIVIVYVLIYFLVTINSNNVSFAFSIVSSIISLLFVNYISPLFRDFVYKKRKADFYNEKALFVKQFDMNYSQDLSYVRTNSTTFIIICNIFLLFLLITTSNEQNQKKDIIIKDSKVNITCDKHKNQCKLDSKNDIDVAPSKD
ncbi:hypothetical protein [Staphylococcus epidermidis]|uniref:hypothetical protein n=1 Tax=Staphylococcus epidermidis TaxID=1282 RepID=UPI00070AE3A0|nr:hypothetical protein [Staphylococcus epidermidis]MCG2105269.1 hypothetical protein [Staphylococcus epidermidis]MCG2123570.1 hypothetical protein [Staphylococcus epidermidis]